jgi:hypothetical protein
MHDDKPVVPDVPGSGGKRLAAEWADAEARAGVGRVGKAMLLLALILLLGAFLTPNPEVMYSLGPGHSAGSSGWSGLIPPLPPSAGFFGTSMNWVTWLLAFLVTDVGALCRFLTIAPVVSKTSPVPDALLYGALGAALLAWKNRVPAVLLLLLAGAGFAISLLRLSGVLAGGAGNVVVSLLVLIAAVRGCQLTWS